MTDRATGFLAGSLIAVILFAVCAPNRVDRPDPTPAPAPDRTADEEVLRLVNEARAQAGLDPVELDERLSAACRTHSAWMEQNRTLTHAGDGTPWSRARDAGYPGWQGCGENAAVGYDSPANLMAGWMDSPGHRQNILTPRWRHMGIGMRGVWATQLFGDPDVE